MACRHSIWHPCSIRSSGSDRRSIHTWYPAAAQLACQLIDHEQGFIDEFSGVSVVNRKRRVSAEQVKIRRCPHCKPFTYSVSFLGVAFASPDGAGSSLPRVCLPLLWAAADLMRSVALHSGIRRQKTRPTKNEHGSQNGLQLHL